MGNQTLRLSPVGNRLLLALPKQLPSSHGRLGHGSPYSICCAPGCRAQGAEGCVAGGEAGAHQPRRSVQRRRALNRWSGRVGAAEDLPHHRISAERL